MAEPAGGQNTTTHPHLNTIPPRFHRKAHLHSTADYSDSRTIPLHYNQHWGWTFCLVCRMWSWSV
ncbi:hypothetical protein PILCRDRAFT_826279 [Piloderma croceum F 1598]|uniref:Uncharacterized protein n=1 Tax=Piloderma croceum (strain F 1598) TaxID=765440 RepID=A0A0C3F9U6_PILCF|nr:hypothetical protein PILCRDRAFT_826279 [Piloderma croceum F 1598]